MRKGNRDMSDTKQVSNVPEVVDNMKGDTERKKTVSVVSQYDAGTPETADKGTAKPSGKVFVIKSGELVSLQIKDKLKGETSSSSVSNKNVIRIIKTSKLLSVSLDESKNKKCVGINKRKWEASTGDDSSPKVVSLSSLQKPVGMKTKDSNPASSDKSIEKMKIDMAVDKNNKRCDQGLSKIDRDDPDFIIGEPKRKRFRMSPKGIKNQEEDKKHISIWTKRKKCLKTDVQNLSKKAPTCNIKLEPQSYEESSIGDGCEFDPDFATVIKLTSMCKNEWQELHDTNAQTCLTESKSAADQIYDENEDDADENSEEMSEFDGKHLLNKGRGRSKAPLDPRIVKVYHSVRSVKSLVFQCTTCGYSSKYKNSVRRHTEHCGNEVTSNRRSCIFPNCDVKFYHVSQMIKHMELMHAASIGVKNLKFSSFQEFLVWKEKEEITNFTYFTKHRGDTQKKNGVYTIYICQNDGSNKSHRKKDEPPRLTNRRHRKGIIKTGGTCPSRMFVTTNQDEVTVKYLYSHNHELKFENTQFHPIAPKSLEYIKRRFSLGASPKQVQDELRNKAVCRDNKDSDGGYVRGQLVSLRTLNAIKRQFLSSFRLDKEDANSVFLLVKEWGKKDFNPVLLYKPQSCPIIIGRSNQFFPLDTDIFFIALQTKEQLETLNSATSHLLCVDTTYCIDKNGFYLFSLIIHNENGHAVPVVHFISNRRTEEILSFFLLSVKDRCPKLQIHGVMTDPDYTGMEATKSVFGYSVGHIVCQWHIKRNWHKKVESLVVDSETHLEMMCALTAMLQETDENTLRNIMLGFKMKYKNTVPKFIDYFQSHIANQPEIWASCHRDTSITNGISNMHCKLFHDKLGIFFSKSKSKKRVDDLLLLLLRIEEDNAEQWKKSVESSISYPTGGDYIVGNHAKSLDIADGDVAELDGSWRIVCQEDRNKVFEVIKVREECLEDFCSAVCEDLPCGNLCSHLYTCSCGSNTGFCEHIHKVHSGKSNVIIICSPDESSSHEESEEVILHEDPYEPEPTEDHKKMLLNSACESLGQLGAFVNQPHIQRALLPHIVTALKQLVTKCREVNQS